MTQKRSTKRQKQTRPSPAELTAEQWADLFATVINASSTPSIICQALGIFLTEAGNVTGRRSMREGKHGAEITPRGLARFLRYAEANDLAVGETGLYNLRTGHLLAARQDDTPRTEQAQTELDPLIEQAVNFILGKAPSLSPKLSDEQIAAHLHHLLRHHIFRAEAKLGDLVILLNAFAHTKSHARREAMFKAACKTLLLEVDFEKAADDAARAARGKQRSDLN